MQQSYIAFENKIDSGGKGLFAWVNTQSLNSLGMLMQPAHSINLNSCT